MKQTIFATDIRSLSEFRSNASGFISQVHATKRPLVITQNGKSTAVLLDVHEYDKLIEKLDLIQDIETAMGQISSGKGIAHAQAHTQLSRRYSQ